MFSAWAVLGNPWGQRPQWEGPELKVFMGEKRSVLLEGVATPHIRESQPLSGGALGVIQTRGS